VDAACTVKPVGDADGFSVTSPFLSLFRLLTN
jgi:hypothetical protein